MSLEIAFLLALFVVAAVLLATERVAPEITALCLVVILAGTGIMSPEDAFAGFASEAIVVLASIMILSRRLSDSGAMSGLSARLAGDRGTSPGMINARLMASSAGLSMVFSNTTTTAVMMPIAIGAARRVKADPGRFLMPMAFASIMGGSATLIGTSTNLAANGAITRMGLEPFSLFEFFVIGVAVTAAGVATVVVLGNRFAGSSAASKSAEEEEDPFLAGLIVAPGSAAAEMALSELALTDQGAEPLAVETDEGRVAPHPRRKLHEGDQIIVSATGTALAKLVSDPRFEVDGLPQDGPVRETADAILLPGSRWIGLSVASMRRTLAPDVTVIGLRRAGYERPARIGLMRLRAGDILLLAGTPEGLARVDADVDLYMLRSAEALAPSRREGWVTLGVTLAAITVAALGLLPLSVSLLAAVLGLILAGRLDVRDAFAMVSWRILILIGGMSSFGLAMLQTGAADLIAEGLLVFIAPMGITAVLIALSLLTVVLTQPLSNAAAALTMLPIAVATAAGLGVDPRPLAVIVTLSASLSFIAPLEPALLLVYGKGHYRLRDFILAGAPLTMVSLALVLFLVPLIWPL
ncbi:MAG: SLC13 family permease [Paracoccaceae bacterium]|nr:SLC13 family permease [Paracoccaceae bacterium]